MKKLICLVLTLVMLMSAVCVSAIAAPADVAKVSAGNVLHFDTSTVDWEVKTFYCHIWAYGGEGFHQWQSKSEACTDTDKDGIWTYDLDAKKVTLEDGVLYACIFSCKDPAGKSSQTYNLLFDKSCLGDTAYCDGTQYENPEDSSQMATAAFWRNQDPAKYGPEKCITSIGNVVGTCVPFVTTVNGMYEDYLVNKLENVRMYNLNEDGSPKSDQVLLDYTASQLGLTKADVETAIANTGVVVEWAAADSTLPDTIVGPTEPTPTEPTPTEPTPTEPTPTEPTPTEPIPTEPTPTEPTPTEPEVIFGDVDGDKVVTVMDATAIQMHLAEITLLDGSLYAVADVDKDTYISIIDATRIQKFLAGLISVL